MEFVGVVEVSADEVGGGAGGRFTVFIQPAKTCQDESVLVSLERVL